MSNIPIRIAAAAVACALPLVGHARAAPTTTTAAARADTGAAANTNATASELTVGMRVKDDTGTPLGKIDKIAAGADGKPVATIKLGADTYRVTASDLKVKNGTAIISQTEAQTTGMIHRPM